MSLILVADDNAQNLYLARILLELAGHQVDQAENGEAAIQAVKSKQYDVVLMDIQMPILDGLTATRRILQEMSEAPPIVALTARVMLGDRESFLAAGCQGYIEKPISAKQFAAQVESFIDTPDSRGKL